MIEFETTRRTTIIVIYDRTENFMFWKPTDNYVTDQTKRERMNFLMLKTRIWKKYSLFIIHFLGF